MLTSSASSTPLDYWEDSYWINPPFTDYRIAELDIYAFTPEGTLAAATKQIDQLTRQGINALVINPDTLFTVTSAQHLCATPTGQATNDTEQLRHFVDVCHYEDIAVCVDLRLTPSDLGTFPEANDHFARGHRQACLENALHWLRDFHIDALRLTRPTNTKAADPFLKQLREAADALTARTGRQYYLLIDCDASPVAIRVRYNPQFLCSVDQPQQTNAASGATGDAPSTLRAYRREFLYETRFARALSDLLRRAA